MAKVQYDAAGRRLPRVPSAHRRFVTRAGTLTKDRHFLAAISDAQTAWNDKSSRFPVALNGPIPTNPWGHPTSEVVYPPALSAANWAMAERLQRRGRLTDADGVTGFAAYEWRQLVLRLCEDWWPPAYYPPSVGNGKQVHPCSRFVSACLVWHPRYAQKEWVISYPFGVECLEYDPTEYGSDPVARTWKLAFDALYENLVEQIETGSVLAREDLDAAATQSCHEAWETIRAEMPSPVQRERFRFVRVEPAMTTADWQGMEPEVMKAIGRTEGEPLAAQARDLHRQGQSGKAIAHLLGVTPRAVRYYLVNDLDQDDETT